MDDQEAIRKAKEQQRVLLKGVHEAIRIAEMDIKAQLATGVEELNWKGIIAVGEFVQTEAESVWSFVATWGCHSSKNLRSGIATCILEHLLEYHFELFFPRV